MAAVTAATQLEALLSLQQELALETDIDRVLSRIVATATSLLDAEGTEPGTIEVREIRLPLGGRSLAGDAARGGGVLRIDLPHEDPRFDPGTDQRTGFRTRSILGAPIDARDRQLSIDSSTGSGTHVRLRIPA